MGQFECLNKKNKTSKMKTIFLLFATSVILSSCAQGEKPSSTVKAGQSDKTAVDISASKAKEIIKKPNVQVLDVRTKEEVSAGTIPGSINIDFYSPDFKQKLETLDKSKPVVVYCAAGGRSAKAMKQMSEVGFKEVYNVTGGYGTLK